jgi:hypothetical protein
VLRRAYLSEVTKVMPPSTPVAALTVGGEPFWSNSDRMAHVRAYECVRTRSEQSAVVRVLRLFSSDCRCFRSVLEAGSRVLCLTILPTEMRPKDPDLSTSLKKSFANRSQCETEACLVK